MAACSPLAVRCRPSDGRARTSLICLSSLVRVLVGSHRPTFVFVFLLPPGVALALIVQQTLCAICTLYKYNSFGVPNRGDNNGKTPLFPRYLCCWSTSVATATDILSPSNQLHFCFFHTYFCYCPFCVRKSIDLFDLFLIQSTGENPAAMQHASSHRSAPVRWIFTLSIVVTFFHLR